MIVHTMTTGNNKQKLFHTIVTKINEKTQKIINGDITQDNRIIIFVKNKFRTEIHHALNTICPIENKNTTTKTSHSPITPNNTTKMYTRYIHVLTKTLHYKPSIITNPPTHRTKMTVQ